MTPAGTSNELDYHHSLQQSHEDHIHFHHQQHQHEVLTQQYGALQQRGFSHDDGMYGLSHLHQHQQSLHGSATAGGGMHAPGVEGQGLSQHRRGPSHPKGSRYGSSVGASRGSGQHSLHGGQMMPPLGGQYGVGHHLFSIMQRQGSTPGGYWGGGRMHYRVPGMINILMDLAGGMPKQMPWVPDGGQQHYVHHLTPQQEDWGSPTQGIGYAPPPPPTLSLQLQQQQQPPLHLAHGVGGVKPR